jgi:hypothetical protein
LDADLGKGVFDFVQLERLDDGLDLLHVSLADWRGQAGTRTPTDRRPRKNALGLRRE